MKKLVCDGGEKEEIQNERLSVTVKLCCCAVFYSAQGIFIEEHKSYTHALF